MLVLSRKPGESLEIGGGVRVTIVRIEGGKVRLGIEAPRDIPVDRSEVYNRKAGQGDAEGKPLISPS